MRSNREHLLSPLAQVALPIYAASLVLMYALITARKGVT